MQKPDRCFSMETVLFFIWNFSSIVFQYCVKTNTKFKYHSGLGDKSCRCEVLAILCVCVCAHVRMCEAWNVFLCSEDSALECQFSCTWSSIMNHIMTALLCNSTRPGVGKLLLPRLLTNGPALKAQWPLHVNFTCISSTHHLFASGNCREKTVESYVNRFKVCFEVWFILVRVLPVWDTNFYDAAEEKEERCSLFASRMEFN